MEKTKIILAITGASGSIYAVKFLEIMDELGVTVHGVISKAGAKVLHLETGLHRDSLPCVRHWFVADDFTAPMASGSSRYQAMAILPCTMGTLSAVANGHSGNLIHRAADVILKERKPLVLATRETPLNKVHLTNMLRAHEAGAVICPPMPAFYHQPETLEAMAFDFAARVASLLGFTDIPGAKSWKGI